jgi:hypothetical protein
MRPEFDREFDALLRRTAGGSRRAPASAEESRRAPDAVAGRETDGRARGAVRASHLDADERAAFAEGALPPVARAAYVSHLADCDECRRSVASLASAAGVALALEKREEPATAGSVPEKATAVRSSWLAALFAARVLRFAAPALALCLVGVVSFVALRSDRGRQGMVATRPAEDRAPAAAQSSADSPFDSAATNANMSANFNSSVTAETATAANAANANASVVGATGNAGGPSGGASGVGAAGLSPAAPDTSAPPAPVANEAAAAASSQSTEQVGVVSAPAALEARDEMRKQEAERRGDTREVAEGGGAPSDRANRSRNYDLNQTPDGARNRARSNQDSSDSRTAAPPPPPAQSGEVNNITALPPSGRSARSTPAPKPDEEGTRAVEGRRFRRVNNVWVDLNYRDSMPSTGVRRGTEEYRALVAELPEVGRVAERLSGEVVVVARGRAYRIKP